MDRDFKLALVFLLGLIAVGTGAFMLMVKQLSFILGGG